MRRSRGVRITAVSCRRAGRLERVKDVIGGTAVDARVITVRVRGERGGEREGEGGREREREGEGEGEVISMFV